MFWRLWSSIGYRILRNLRICMKGFCRFSSRGCIVGRIVFGFLEFWLKLCKKVITIMLSTIIILVIPSIPSISTIPPSINIAWCRPSEPTSKIISSIIFSMRCWHSPIFSWINALSGMLRNSLIRTRKQRGIVRIVRKWGLQELQLIHLIGLINFQVKAMYRRIYRMRYLHPNNNININFTHYVNPSLSSSPSCP